MTNESPPLQVSGTYRNAYRFRCAATEGCDGVAMVLASFADELGTVGCVVPCMKCGGLNFCRKEFPVATLIEGGGQ